MCHTLQGGRWGNRPSDLMSAPCRLTIIIYWPNRNTQFPSICSCTVPSYSYQSDRCLLYCDIIPQGLQENKKLNKVRPYFDVCPFSESFSDVFANTFISLLLACNVKV